MNASPVHLDAARAAQGPFGAPIVVGVITAAIAEGLASHLISPDLGRPIGWETIKLVAPVRVGDMIQVETSQLKPNSAARSAPRRVLTRAFTGGGTLVAELVTLYRSSRNPQTHRPSKRQVGPKSGRSNG